MRFNEAKTFRILAKTLHIKMMHCSSPIVMLGRYLPGCVGDALLLARYLPGCVGDALLLARYLPGGVGDALLLGLDVLLDGGLPLLLVPLVDRVDLPPGLALRIYRDELTNERAGPGQGQEVESSPTCRPRAGRLSQSKKNSY